MTNEPKILLLDLETSPNIVTAFSLGGRSGYHLKPEDILQERYIICGAWKWFRKPGITAETVHPKDPQNDRLVVHELSCEIAKADAIVAHWGSQFDFPWLRGRALFHKLQPIAPAREYDTCVLARRAFNLNSIKLDYLAQYLGIGSKLPTQKKLWLDCLKGDAKALKTMTRYCKHDVLLLDQVLDRMLPHLPAIVNTRLTGENRLAVVCPHCGSADLEQRGYRYTVAHKWVRYQCKGCHSWCSKPHKGGTR
jgi:hypothetical protein